MLGIHPRSENVSCSFLARLFTSASSQSGVVGFEGLGGLRAVKASTWLPSPAPPGATPSGLHPCSTVTQGNQSGERCQRVGSLREPSGIDDHRPDHRTHQIRDREPHEHPASYSVASLYFSPRGEAKYVRGPSRRGASRLARTGVLEQYVEHGKQAQQSPGGHTVCFGRRVVPTGSRDGQLLHLKWSPTSQLPIPAGHRLSRNIVSRLRAAPACSPPL